MMKSPRYTFQALKDCEKALEIDKYNTKAGYLLGLVYSNRLEYKQAIERFEQAVEMSHRQGKPKSFTMEVTQALRRTKRTHFEIEEEKRKKKLVAMRDWVMAALQEHKKLKGESQTAEEQEEADSHVSSLIALVDESMGPEMRQVPDAFTCSISMDVFQDPVVTPSGMSYERRFLEEHLRKANFDPLTRKPLSITQLYPNTALKQAADHYLDENPWAFEA